MKGAAARAGHDAGVEATRAAPSAARSCCRSGGAKERRPGATPAANGPKSPDSDGESDSPAGPATQGDDDPEDDNQELSHRGRCDCAPLVTSALPCVPVATGAKAACLAARAHTAVADGARRADPWLGRVAYLLYGGPPGARDHLRSLYPHLGVVLLR